MLKLFVLMACAALAGCASNPRFATEVPASHITGESVCEVPQFWKALALQGLNTKTLEKAVVVQVKIPPEFVGDTLGWFVEGEEARTMEHYPRIVWQALVINQRGEKQFAPAIMKNPLTSPVLTVVITDPSVHSGDEVSVYVPSGAYTKLLTTGGDLLRLSTSKDCLGLVNAEFLRTFPSQATAVPASPDLLAGIRGDFSIPSLQSDGVVYSLSQLAYSPQVAGDLRQVDQKERIAERGMTLFFPAPIATGLSVGIALATTGEDIYVGPFGERLYSPGEANAAFGRYLKGYNSLKGTLERLLGDQYSPDVTSNLTFAERKSGWEIGVALAPRVRELWETLDHLKERYQSRTKEKGALLMKKTTHPGLSLPSGPPSTLWKEAP